MTPRSSAGKASESLLRRKRHLPGATQDDSGDELAGDDIPWEWVYDTKAAERDDDTPKRRKITGNKIVAARIGQFECRIGDIVLLKADGSNEAWVAIICDFVEADEEGEKAANFMWFSTEKEIRNRERKLTDFYAVRSPEIESFELNN